MKRTNIYNRSSRLNHRSAPNALRGFSLEAQFYRFSDKSSNVYELAFHNAPPIAKAIELNFEAKASKSTGGAHMELINHKS